MQKTFTEADFWNERYQDTNYAYGEKPNDFLQQNASIFKKAGKILSLGEGEGRNGVFLAEHGYDVRGVDFSKKGQTKALALAKSRNVNINYDISDIAEYDLGENKWDGVISIFFPISEKIRMRLFHAIKLSLKEGGIFLLEAYNKKQLDFDTGGPKDITYLLSLDEVADMFHDFEVAMARDIERTINEGDLHNGLSSVTQFIARKKP